MLNTWTAPHLTQELGWTQSVQQIRSVTALCSPQHPLTPPSPLPPPPTPPPPPFPTPPPPLPPPSLLLLFLSTSLSTSSSSSSSIPLPFFVHHLLLFHSQQCSQWCTQLCSCYSCYTAADWCKRTCVCPDCSACQVTSETTAITYNTISYLPLLPPVSRAVLPWLWMAVSL